MRIPDGFAPAWLRRLHARVALRQQIQVLEHLGYPVHSVSDLLDPPVTCTGDGEQHDLTNVVAMSKVRPHPLPRFTDSDTPGWLAT